MQHNWVVMFVNLPVNIDWLRGFALGNIDAPHLGVIGFSNVSRGRVEVFHIFYNSLSVEATHVTE
jgi:hypothetical protein